MCYGYFSEFFLEIQAHIPDLMALTALFFALRANKASAKGQSSQQELEVSPRSRYWREKIASGEGQSLPQELEVSPRSRYRREKIASGESRSPLQGLEVSPHSGLYLLVLSKAHSLRMEDFSMFSAFKAFNTVGSDLWSSENARGYKFSHQC